MFCPKCGKGVQQGASFCMHCGQSLAVAVAPTGAAPAFPTPTRDSKKVTLIAAGTALALLLAVFLGLRASGLLQFGAKNPKLETLSAQGAQPGNPLLRAEGTSGPATLNQPATRVEMPPDVRAWLEHLERIENRKNELSLKQLSQMAVLMQQMKVLGGAMGLLNPDSEAEDSSPSDTARASFDQLRPDWTQLIADFQSKAPPAECKPIADDYLRAISEIPGMNSDLAAVLEGASTDPAKALEAAMNLQNKSGGVIDRYLGETDGKVADICRKYETRKWFSIKSDVGGGLMGKFGL
jgi:hypothetical protein